MFSRLFGHARENGYGQGASLGALAPAGVAATVIYVLFIGLPIVALLVRAGQQDGFLAGLTGGLVVQALRLTVVTSLVSMVVVVVVGTPFALLLARRRSTVLRVIDTFVELPIVLPPVVAGVGDAHGLRAERIAGPRRFPPRE